MLWYYTLVIGAGLAQAASTLKVLDRRWDDVTAKHSWGTIPNGWEFVAPAPSTHSLTLRIGLKQNKVETLIENLLEISNPSSHRYTQHLSASEIETFLAPHPSTTAAVDDWLAFHGISASSGIQRTPAGDWVTLIVPVSQAERMLNTKYNIYQHTSSGDQVVRTLSYSLPKELHDHVDVVAPTTYFGTMRSMKKTSFLLPDVKSFKLTDPSEKQALADAAQNCSQTVTPNCLRNLYKTKNYVPKKTDVNKLGIAGYLEEYANKADHAAFFKMFRPDVPLANISAFETVLVHGGKDNQSVPGIEANLDIQYTTGISYPTPNIYYSVGGSPPFNPDSFAPTNTNEPYLDFVNYISSQTEIPQVISTSYGDDEQTVPQDYANRVCQEFAALGSRGVTLLFSSGDEGVGGGDCTTNDGTNRKIFQPAFPASCPFVTTVGATTGINPEVATDFSGGGFSRYFSRPQYQKSAVGHYLSLLGTTNKGLFNASGRAYPDISAQGLNFQVVVGGVVRNVAGTSASAPTVAAIFSLLNDYRLSKNKAPLGFINPLIYSTLSSGFNDVVSGSNPGCNTNGFQASPGWDPVTGLGTPDFEKLVDLL